jgi:hypothetical protein
MESGLITSPQIVAAMTEKCVCEFETLSRHDVQARHGDV